MTWVVFGLWAVAAAWAAVRLWRDSPGRCCCPADGREDLRMRAAYAEDVTTPGSRAVPTSGAAGRAPTS